MIIRNPYNFIVKHYKIIHLLLLVPMLYLALKFGDIAGFFNDYIAQGYSTPETNFADTYVTLLMWGTIAFMLIVNITLYFIFGSKKKNNLYYGISIIYYFILMIGLILFGSAMSSIERDSLEPTFANFIRDCSFIAYLPMYVLMVLDVIKGVGFNIRTFRFDNNADLKINDDDDEEIEIKVGADNNSVKRNMVHLIRELKYYVLENKFVFSCIGVVLFLFVGYVTYTNYQVYNKTYASNQAIQLNTFSISLKEAYLTNVDYQGKIIADNKYYLAVKMGVENPSTRNATSIETSYFRLYIGDEIIYPSYDRSSRFIDIGRPYQGEDLQPEEADEFVFVYELNKDQIKSSYQIRILTEAPVIKNDKLVSKYKKINIKPQNIIKESNIGTTSLGKEISLKDTTLGNTNYTLKKLEVLQSYQYTYKKCSSTNICSDVTDTMVPTGGNALVVIEDEIEWDENSSYYKNSKKDFYNDFVTITYQFNVLSGRDRGDKVVTTTLKNVTPKTITDKKIYEVPSTLLNADKIDLNLKIRNKSLTLNVK